VADPEKIDLVDDVIMVAVRIVRQTFRVSLSAIVTNFARDTSRAAVDFGAKFLGTDRSVRTEPQVADLPVITPRGGGYGVYFDFRPGDLGVVLCQDGPVRGLYETGDPVVPQFPQGHDLGCGVIFPGGRVSNTETPTPPPNDAGTLMVGADDGSASVVFKGAGLPSPAEVGTVVVAAAGPTASVLLGGATAAIPVACATQTAANFTAINTTIQALPAVPGDPGVIAALKTAFATYASTLQDVADAKARVEGPGP
jgi:hypothetical protein